MGTELNYISSAQLVELKAIAKRATDAEKIPKATLSALITRGYVKLLPMRSSSYPKRPVVITEIGKVVLEQAMRGLA